MRILSNRFFILMLGMASMASCSRPVAYFQPAAREPIARQSQSDVPLSGQPLVEPGHERTLLAEHTSPSIEPVAQAKQAVSQLEAYVRNDSKLVSNQKLAKRLVRLNEALAATKPSATLAQPTARKTTFMERTMLKKLDKKLKQHLAPDQPKAVSSTILTGIIIALVGLLLVIIASGFFNTLGIIALVVGVGLIVYSYLTSK